MAMRTKYRSGSVVIKLVSCSTQLSMEFFPVLKCQTVGILIFISKSESLKPRSCVCVCGGGGILVVMSSLDILD